MKQPPAINEPVKAPRRTLLDPDSVAHILGGKAYGDTIRCPGPGHSAKDDSLAVTLDANAPDGFVVYSHSGDDWTLCRDYVRQSLGLDPFRKGERPVQKRPPPVRIVQKRDDDEWKRTRGLLIWSEATPNLSAVVRPYLASRGLVLPEGAPIRFHARCPFGETTTPAMVALVTDIQTNEPVAIHRTALSLDGRNVEIDGHKRLSLGPTKGGAIKLTPDEEVTTCLGVGEGIESVLSLRCLPEFGCSPVWSVLSAGGIEDFPVLPGIECLWIAVDNDGNERGREAADACADRWLAAGREVFRVRTTLTKTDLNDVVTKGGRRHG